jgi:poly(glycerol-phosphate) alpha-glucosyltransferase
MHRRLDTLVYDYLRSDGSTFLRIPAFSFQDPQSWPTLIQPVSRAGEALKPFTSLGKWFRNWVKELAQDERAFVFVETRVLTPHLVPMKPSNIHLIQVMHNVHTLSPHHWNSPVTPLGQMLLDRMDGLDAVVNLSERQHVDIKLRRGATNNLFVVPNPVSLPDKTESRARDPRLVTIVARLTPQKRLRHAIDAFDKVLATVPDARLEIFGKGPEAPMLRAQVKKRGLSGSVILRGWDPDARQALEKSSAFMMTSLAEGYPLATLESMSHGCPVVSYDIKYGPRDQITDGLDGFLVPDEDTTAMAERVVRLLKSPELVARMGRAAVAKAEQHSSARFATDWAHVLQSVVRQKETRTKIASTELEVTRLSVGRRGMVGRRTTQPVDSVPGVHDDDATLSFEGVLRVRGRGAKESLECARVELVAVHSRSGDLVELPVSVSRRGKSFAVRAEARLGDLMGCPAAEGPVQLRLRLVWGNCARDSLVTRPVVDSAGVEVAFLADGSLALQRFTVPPGRPPAAPAHSPA